jgi:hypothetical protein
MEIGSGCEKVDWLPWSLRYVAGAPQTARKKMPATLVGMTESEENTGRSACATWRVKLG